MTTVSEATYEVLRARGLTTVFGNPGSNELPFLSGMPDDFRYILGLHEGAVLSMADGYSLVSGDAVFVNLHAASGSGNAMGALTNSVYSHSPLVVTAGQQVRSTIGQEVMLSNVDAGTLLKPLVKWSSEPTCAEDVPRTINQAIHTALLPAKGPVYVSVPYDDWAHQAPADSADLVHRQVHSAAAISGDQLDSLAEILATATNPALVLGPAVDADHANNHAVQLADTLRAPVWIAPSPSRCPFPTRHPSFRGVLPAGIADLASTLNGHDVVLVIGAPVFRYHQYVPGNYLPDGTRLIQITDDPGEAARAPVGEAYVAPVGATLDALSSLIEPSTRPPLPPETASTPRSPPGTDSTRPTCSPSSAPPHRTMRSTSTSRLPPPTPSGPRWICHIKAATTSPPRAGWVSASRPRSVRNSPRRNAASSASSATVRRTTASPRCGPQPSTGFRWSSSS